MNYQEKLKDPRWQKKRLEILEDHGWACDICQETEETLHVHHLKYKGDPWDVPNNYLSVLCETCHDSEHSTREQHEKDINAFRIMMEEIKNDKQNKSHANSK